MARKVLLWSRVYGFEPQMGSNWWSFVPMLTSDFNKKLKNEHTVLYQPYLVQGMSSSISIPVLTGDKACVSTNH